jgi:hypothetical protein
MLCSPKKAGGLGIKIKKKKNNWKIGRLEPRLYDEAYLEPFCAIWFPLGCLGEGVVIEREDFLAT